MIKDMLLKNIRKDPDTGCWIWTGQVSSSGYGRLIVPDGRGGKSLHSAHQASYTVFVGPIPDGMLVRQSCNNRLCINPDHLEVFKSTGK